MTGNKASRFAHKTIGDVYTTHVGVRRTGLYHNPLTKERHDVMPPNDVCFNNFSCTGIN